ncbi:nucleotidyl transferase AbiEii/AbiGii toxin family protein [Desulfofundulus thermocisternus]|uniref:nucleotidyl transferase AbiEii/AbiGii toxin family protein n=1 Tax=Desulfofundulus thermocisternus TaxID=42471 RepID=UPI0009FDAE46|nr:nucleotidyl transferase AbiEii/AbiGii toxin family protein [Desulfofundulus thermocisternus]
MFASALPQRGQKALELLSSAGLLRDFYLAGGTALALHLGHRLSDDLDFFFAFPRGYPVAQAKAAGTGKISATG